MKLTRKHLIALLLLACPPMLAASELHVVVNKNLPVESMNAMEIKAIYLARRDSFADGKKAIPLDQKNDSPTYEYFYKNVVHKNISEVNSYWSRKIFTGGGVPPKQLASNQEVIRMVSENPAYIGYVSGKVDSDKVRVVYTVKD